MIMFMDCGSQNENVTPSLHSHFITTETLTTIELTWYAFSFTIKKKTSYAFPLMRIIYIYALKSPKVLHKDLSEF